MTVFFQNANSFLGVAAGGGLGTEASPFSTWAQFIAQLNVDANDIALHPGLVWTPANVIGGNANGCVDAKRPPSGVTVRRWDVPGFEQHYPTFDSHQHIAVGDWVNDGGGVWRTAITGFNGSNQYTGCWGGHRLGDNRGIEHYRLVPLRRCGLMSQGLLVGDYAFEDSGADSILRVRTDGINPTTFWGGFSIHMSAGYGQALLYVRGCSNLTFVDVQAIGAGFLNNPNGYGDNVNINYTRPRHRAGIGNAISYYPFLITERCLGGVIDEPYFDSEAHQTLPTIGLSMEVRIQNGANIGAGSKDIVVKNPRIKDYSHGNISTEYDPAKSPDRSWPFNIHVLKTHNKPGYNVLDSSGAGYQRCFNMVHEGFWSICGTDADGKGIECRNGSVQSQVGGNGFVEVFFNRSRHFDDPLNSKFGLGSQLAVLVTAGQIEATKIAVKSVFFEPANFAFYCGSSLAPGALNVTGSLVIDTENYFTRQRPNVSISGIAAELNGAGSFLFNATSSGATGVVQGVNQSMFVLPAGQTTTGSLKPAGVSTNNVASFTKYVAGSGAGGYMAGNAQPASLAAAGFNPDLSWASDRASSVSQRGAARS